ncbi:hypothetical protein 14D047_00105 [Fowlpox virus]|uniref:Uncharacterized protein n=1 Tax=Fowlpox virus TaxID=10261 RepID=A0A7G0X4L8_FOWPV|nr:hypothetical protein [Fowlpox virus]URH25082.1 hypothetical protein 13D121_00106 [Fowlpox virus]URH25346.1 hypothetical protein 14D047_00105 [Fowlpox virus]URH25865.1 hypothetical protein 18Q061_00105 [Fowlpox virus]URH26129.1 hypothetical protein 18R056_00106 [Fowlpox virus]
MFKNYKYTLLSEDTNNMKLLIPGLEDDMEAGTIENSGYRNISTKMFKDQVKDIVKKTYNQTYLQLLQLLERSNVDCNELELLYRIININPRICHRFYINRYDSIFGSFNKLHEFISNVMIKIFKIGNSIYITFISDNTSLEINVDNDTEGRLMNIDYTIKFGDVIILQLGRISIKFSGNFVIMKDILFLVADSNKIVYNEDEFLLEIYNT